MTRHRAGWLVTAGLFLVCTAALAADTRVKTSARHGVPTVTHVNIPVRPGTKTVDLEPVANDEEVGEFIRLVNEYRRKKGCPVLLWDARLAAVAQRHSEDMAKREYFSHTNPDGVRPDQRLKNAGITFVRMGENLAVGQRTARDVLDAWLESPDHRRNIEDCAFTHHGVGFYKNRWTHLFLTPTYRR